MNNDMWPDGESKRPYYRGEKIRSQPAFYHRYVWQIATVVLAVLVVALLLNTFFGPKPTPPSSVQVQPTHATSQQPAATPTTVPASLPTPSPTPIPSPVPTPSPAPTPSPTPVPNTVSKTGDVCQPAFSAFQATGWVAEKSSFVFTGNGANVVISPCTLTTANYSVEATIMLLNPNSARGVGIVAHADTLGQKGYAAGAGCRNISFGRCGFFINDFFSDIMGVDQEVGLAGQTHTYKLVVNGINLQLFYDKNPNPIDSKSLATYVEAGFAGFECYDQCQVTSFKVVGL